MKRSKRRLPSFVLEKQREIARRSLAKYPKPDAREKSESRGIEKFFTSLRFPIVLRHPTTDLKLQITSAVHARIAYLLSVGDYEQDDVNLLQKHLRRGDRVLELGAGMGLTAALSATLTGRAVTVVDANPELASLLKAQARLNRVKISFLPGCVVGENFPARSIDFFVHEELWFSGTRRRGQHARKIRVPTRPLSELLERERPTFLMIDIEGNESQLFHESLNHLPRTLLIEIHSPLIGRAKALRVMRELRSLGYRKIDQAGWSYVFRLPRRPKRKQ